MPRTVLLFLLLLLFLAPVDCELTTTSSANGFASSLSSTGHAARSTAASSTSTQLHATASTQGTLTAVTSAAHTSTTQTTTRATSATSSVQASTSVAATSASSTTGVAYNPIRACTPLILITSVGESINNHPPSYGPLGAQYGVQAYFYPDTPVGHTFVTAGAYQRNLLHSGNPFPKRAVLAELISPLGQERCLFYEYDIWLQWGILMANGIYSVVEPLSTVLQSPDASDFGYTNPEMGMIHCGVGQRNPVNNPIYLWKQENDATQRLTIYLAPSSNATGAPFLPVVSFPSSSNFSTSVSSTGSSPFSDAREDRYWIEKTYLLFVSQICLYWTTYRTFGTPISPGQVASTPMVCSINNAMPSSTSVPGLITVWWEQLNADQLAIFASSQAVTTSSVRSTPVVLARVPLLKPLAASYYNASLLQFQIVNAMCNQNAQMLMLAGGDEIHVEQLLLQHQDLLHELAADRPVPEDSEIIIDHLEATLTMQQLAHDYLAAEKKTKKRTDPWS